MVGDVGNAYLEAYTKELVGLVAGPEFGDHEGHTLIIVKALYGLRSSGCQWAEKYVDTMRDMGFMPCKMDPDIWLRDAGDVYELVCVYVNDNMCMMKEPAEFFETLINDYGYKLKGFGEPVYHIGGVFSRDEGGTLCYDAKWYIKTLLTDYERQHNNEKPDKKSCPLDPKFSPELDTSTQLGTTGIKK